MGNLADATACAAGYAVGSIPVGLWMGRLKRGLDVREHGSGSTGSTNVLRILGPQAAAATFALDVAKGSVAVLAARALGASDAGQVGAGLAAMVGHSWPALAKFRGGKSVATAFGGLLLLAPESAPFAVVSGLSALAATRTVSVGSLAAAGGATGGATLMALRGGKMSSLAFAAGATALILVRHRPNITRLGRGDEPRLGAKRAHAGGAKDGA